MKQFLQAQYNLCNILGKFILNTYFYGRVMSTSYLDT